MSDTATIPQRVLTVHAELLHTNRMQRKTLDGRLYAVAPVVAMVAGVRNGALLPAEDLAAFVAAWDGRPIALRHPQEDGIYVTANSPDIIEQQVLGQFFNAYMDGAALKGELWLDESKVQRLGGDALDVLRRLDDGRPLEVSVAYWADVEPGEGVYEGERYLGVQRNLRPDHVALLPDQIGACSWADGCGAPRVNAASDDAQYSGVIVAFFLSPSAASELVQEFADWPAGSEVLPAADLHITLAYLGDVEQVSQIIDEARLLQMLANFAQGVALVYGTVSGVGRFSTEPDQLGPVYLSVDAPGLSEFRQALLDYLSWEVPVSRRHGFTPHITLAYVPPSADVTLLPPAQRSLAFNALALAWAGRVTMFPLQGQERIVDETGPAVNCSCEATMKASNQEEVQATVTPALVANDDQGNTGDVGTEVEMEAVAGELLMPAELQELSDLVREMGGIQAVRDALQSVTVNAQRTKDDLVGRLATNQQCAFGKADLDGMTVDMLQKLDRSLRPADYTGRGGLRSQAVADDDGWATYKA